MNFIFRPRVDAGHVEQYYFFFVIFEKHFLINLKLDKFELQSL